MPLKKLSGALVLGVQYHSSKMTGSLPYCWLPQLAVFLCQVAGVPVPELGSSFNSSVTSGSSVDVLSKQGVKFIHVFVGFLRGGCSRGGGNWGTLRIPREDWGTLGNIRED